MLHIVNRSPFEKNSLETCLRLSANGSHILLFEDGVYGALAGGNFESNLRTAMSAKKVYALAADLEARGIASAQLIAGIEVVGYDGFVELAAKCDKVQSWI